MPNLETAQPDSAPSPIWQRIKERLDALDLSERQASRQAFDADSSLRNVRTGVSKHPGVNFFEKLAPVLHCSPEWLAFGAGPPPGVTALPFGRPGVAAATLQIVGEVAAGQWLEVDTQTDAPAFLDYEGGPIPPDPNYDVAQQFAVLVRGTSINRVANDGDVLGCVKVRPDTQPTAGQVVIVERVRFDGSEIERTAKRLRKGEGGALELWPDSTDPRWQSVLTLGTDDGDETVRVGIIGIATWVHGPIKRDLRAPVAKI